MDGKLGLRVCRDIQPGTELLLWKEQEQEAPLEKNKEVIQLKVCGNSCTPSRQQEDPLEAVTLDYLSGCAGEFIHNICTVLEVHDMMFF